MIPIITPLYYKQNHSYICMYFIVFKFLEEKKEGGEKTHTKTPLFNLTTTYGKMSPWLAKTTYGKMSPWLAKTYGKMSPWLAKTTYGKMSPWLAKTTYGKMSPWLAKTTYGKMSPWLAKTTYGKMSPWLAKTTYGKMSPWLAKTIYCNTETQCRKQSHTMFKSRFVVVVVVAYQHIYTMTRTVHPPAHSYTVTREMCTQLHRERSKADLTFHLPTHLH